MMMIDDDDDDDSEDAETFITCNLNYSVVRIVGNITHLSFITRCAATLVPPEDSPARTTLSLSPPNASMFS